MQKIFAMDEHLIGIDALCDRLGYRSEYFLKVGVTLSHVKYAQEREGRNEITNYWTDFSKMLSNVFGNSCGSA